MNLHTFLVHPVAAAQLQEIITFLNEPLAEVASLTLDHSICTSWVVLCLDLEVHLIDLFRREFRLLYWFYGLCL